MKQLYFFYQIVCLDAKVTDSYIGTTRDLKRRCIKHKSVCHKENSPGYKFKLYKFIRKNGGWSNWVMFPLDVLETDDYVAVRQKETELMKLHKSTLNTINSYRSFEDKKVYDKEFYLLNKIKINQRWSENFSCKCGGKYTRNHKLSHLRTAKHKAFLCKLSS